MGKSTPKPPEPAKAKAKIKVLVKAPTQQSAQQAATAAIKSAANALPDQGQGGV